MPQLGHEPLSPAAGLTGGRFGNKFKGSGSCRVCTLLRASAWVLLMVFGTARSDVIAATSPPVVTHELHLPAAGIHSLKADPANSARIFATTPAGLYVSHDGGGNWHSVQIDERIDETFDVSIGGSFGEVILVGRRDGLWRSEDGGRQWLPLPSPATAPVIPLALDLSRSNPRIVYMTTARHGVFRSMDGGYRWDPINDGLPQSPGGDRIAEIRTLAVHPQKSAVAFVATGDPPGIHRTLDGGTTWVAASAGLPLPLAETVGTPRLVFDPAPPFRLYVAITFRIHSKLVTTQLFATSDTGDWVPLLADLPPNIQLRALEVDSQRRDLQLWADEAILEVPLLP